MKSQASIEFIAFVSILLIIAIIVVSSWWPITNEAQGQKVYTQARDTLTDVTFHIDTAQKIGDGYIGRFFVPENLLGVDYQVDIERHFVTFTWDNKTTAQPILAENVTGSVQKGWNTIKNIKGVVYVN